MEFIRSDSGRENRDLFYFPKILVYVEGYSDIPFYEEVLQNYNYHLKARGGREECKKLVTALVEKDLPYVVVLDGDYKILERTRSQHRRVVWLHRYSFENYLFEEKPIKQFCRDHAHLEDSLEELLASSEFTDFIQNIEIKFKDLIILDIAHQRAETGYDTLPDRPDRFFKSQTGIDFLESQIQQWQTETANCIDNQNVDNARALVEQFSKKHRFIDLFPGHFAFGIMRRLIINTINRRHRRTPNISNDTIKIYLSREVWSLVKTRDHNSLKRRLRRAVREAEQMRKSGSNQAQSNTRS